MNMKLIICLIIFQTVFGKNFLVEVENDPKGNELSSVEKLEAELDNSLDEEDEDEDKEMLETTKNAGEDYFAPYARQHMDCKGEKSHKKNHIEKRKQRIQ